MNEQEYLKAEDLPETPRCACAPAAHRTPRGNQDEVSIVAGGGLRSAGHFVKCLAVGADAVYIGTAALIAINCQQYRVCDSDKCPTGVTAQAPWLTPLVRPEEGDRRLTSFIRVRTEEIVDLARITGRARLADLDRDDLVSADRDLSRRTGVRWMGGRAQD